MKILEINNVFKNYSLENRTKFTALHDINISFEKGELISIIGESGSGKSTLMNLIGGLDSAYTGEIKISGKDLKEFKERDLDDYRKKKIGFVFQSFNLIPHLSVLENVSIGLTLSNEKETIKNKKAYDMLCKLGLGDQIRKKPTQLSGGQKQRVAIARALINNPDIILADEPTGALDSTTSGQILNILKEIADSGKLVIMVTHSEKVAKISSRIVEISDGRIIKDEKNKNYLPMQAESDLITEEQSEEQTASCNENSTDTVYKKAKKRNKKEGHLSLFSAFKLSIHNMWASKAKNFLMAIGVSISLIALIIMLSFGAGLTGYIEDEAAAFNDPMVATITKSLFPPQTFTTEEIDKLVIDLNDYLKSKNSDFEVKTKDNDEFDYNLSYGFNMVTGFGDTENAIAKISYQPAPSEEEPEPEVKESAIFYSYTTPPYYTEKNLLTKNSRICGDREIMLSAAAGKALGIDNLEDVIDKTVTLSIKFPEFESAVPTEVKISGIVDVPIVSNMLIMFIDYDYLSDRVKENSDADGLPPSTLYIVTDDTKTTQIINDFVSSRKDLSGSLEDSVANIFRDMLDTFSFSLSIISAISLAVALIMITVVLYMSVDERTKEIGVLKSIGARKQDIKLIFSTESFLVGILSAITGIILSLMIGGILTFIFNSIFGFAPLKMLWYFFFEALGISIGISILAGLYPSTMAARLDPVEALRHE